MNHLQKKALEVLKNGGVIAYPTDTTYGIGCDALDIEAVKRVFEIKGRDFSKPLSLAFSDLEMLKKYAKIDQIVEHFAAKVLPGPVTLLLPRKDSVEALITAGSNKVGVRIPDYPPILELISQLGHPIVTTSANLSGESDALSAAEVSLPVDYILVGECRHKQPSTIIDVANKTIVRKGFNYDHYLQLIERYLKIMTRG